MIYEIIEKPEKKGVKAMFVAPKKKFRDAHDRNKIKRRMREAYRVKKSEFYAGCDADKQYLISFVFYGAKPEPYVIIQSAMSKLLTSKLK